jgi:acyl-[acyl-carrier-protein]-phospholipid O-acyltransferase/long-chain-fatty-acid--[acyl-carrier-protein] ligase
MEPVHEPPPASPARFGAYLYTQFFSAFNDNVHFFAIALYLTYTASRTPEEAGRWQAIAGAAFVFPFILFSPFAGTLADRYPKRTVLIWTKWLEIVPMSVSFLSALFLPTPIQYYGLILGIFLMETRSAFFSPPKYGILPEIMPNNRLVRANGILQMLTMVAIVSGEAIAGTLLHRVHLQNTIGVCLILSVVGSLLASGIPSGAPGDGSRKLDLNPIAKIWGTLKDMRGDRVLIATAFTLACFWLVSAIFRSNVPLFGKLALEINEEKSSRLMAFVSVGIGIGAALASIIKDPDASMAAVLPGVFGMVLAVLGLFGGLYLVPQTTVYQARSPADRRGEYLAVQNFINYAFMLGSALVFHLLTNTLHLTPQQIFIGVGIGLVLLGVSQIIFQRALVLAPLQALFRRGAA